MKIIIIGAGRVGSSVAESLVSEANDITVIDSDPARVADLQDRFDLRGLVGNAALPSTLHQAGAEDSRHADRGHRRRRDQSRRLQGRGGSLQHSRRASRACATSSCRSIRS